MAGFQGSGIAFILNCPTPVISISLFSKKSSAPDSFTNSTNRFEPLPLFLSAQPTFAQHDQSRVDRNIEELDEVSRVRRDNRKLMRRPPDDHVLPLALEQMEDIRSDCVFITGGETMKQGVKLMVHTIVEGTFRQTNLTNESPEYLAKREELRLAEIELMRQRERVADLRRHLPEGAAMQDYEFQEGPRDLNVGDSPVRSVRLSELFTKPNRALVIYHFMFGKRQGKACPMCTAWLDGANGVAHHLVQNLDFAVVAAADVPTLRAHARSRGWEKLRLLSAGDSTFKYDLGSEDHEANQDSTVSVFTRDNNGTVRHFYTAHPRMSPDIEERGIDLLAPIWHFMDLTPQGRGSWYASLSYGTKLQAA